MNAEAVAIVVTAVIAALGGASIIPKTVDGIRAHLDRRAKDEKTENQTLLGRAAHAEARADDEANFRRRIEEWAGGLVYMLKQIGVPDNQIPAKPTRQPANSKG